MALYPSLEDLRVGQLIKAQVEAEKSEIGITNTPYAPSAPQLPAYDCNTLARYPALHDYMGLELSRDVIAANMPEYLEKPNNMQLQSTSSFLGLVAPVSGNSLHLTKSIVTNGIREVFLNKDTKGKVGLRVQSINNGVFIILVTKESSAARAGLRFGDQLLEVNGKSVAGMSEQSVYDILKKGPDSNISLIVRDRPLERTITLHKDATGHVGFSFKDGKIVRLVLNSSAAKNGLLTNHSLLEVNGQNVVGLKDKEITKIISTCGDVLTITIVPSFIYEHMTKKMSNCLMKNMMDHSPIF